MAVMASLLEFSVTQMACCGTRAVGSPPLLDMGQFVPRGSSTKGVVAGQWAPLTAPGSTMCSEHVYMVILTSKVATSRCVHLPRQPTISPTLWGGSY